MRPFLLTLAVCLTGGIAQADIMYQFNVNADAPIKAFSFSFTVPNFVGIGATPAFTPFTVTDGTASWTMTDDLVAGPPADANTCFDFGTSGKNFHNACGVGGTTGGELVLLISALPTQAGTYGLSNGQANLHFAGSDSFIIKLDLTSSLVVSDVSSVPEPTSILLLGSILAAVGWRLRRRAA